MQRHCRLDELLTNKQCAKKLYYNLKKRKKKSLQWYNEYQESKYKTVSLLKILL